MSKARKKPAGEVLIRDLFPDQDNMSSDNRKWKYLGGIRVLTVGAALAMGPIAGITHVSAADSSGELLLDLEGHGSDGVLAPVDEVQLDVADSHDDPTPPTTTEAGTPTFRRVSPDDVNDEVQPEGGDDVEAEEDDDDATGNLDDDDDATDAGADDDGGDENSVQPEVGADVGANQQTGGQAGATGGTAANQQTGTQTGTTGGTGADQQTQTGTQVGAGTQPVPGVQTTQTTSPMVSVSAAHADVIAHVIGGGMTGRDISGMTEAELIAAAQARGLSPGAVAGIRNILSGGALFQPLPGEVIQMARSQQQPAPMLTGVGGAGGQALEASPQSVEGMLGSGMAPAQQFIEGGIGDLSGAAPGALPRAGGLPMPAETLLGLGTLIAGAGAFLRRSFRQ